MGNEAASESRNGVAIVHAESVAAWRDWLKRHGRRQTSVWLIVHHQGG